MASRLGSTTHVSVLDADGWACAVTTTNGEGSGLVVPGTGIHVNNMMGEQDLSPAGWFTHPPGRRLPSMMAPTIVLDDGSPELVLGSAGSNRIRSAIVQVIVNAIDRGMDAQAAVDAPRLHFEDGLVYAEPGIDAGALEAPAQVAWFRDRNLFFGGCQAVERHHGTRRVQRRRGSAPGRGGGDALDRDHLRHVRRVQGALQQVRAGLGEAAPVAAAVGQPRRAEPERAGRERDVVLDAALGEAPACTTEPAVTSRWSGVNAQPSTTTFASPSAVVGAPAPRVLGRARPSLPIRDERQRDVRRRPARALEVGGRGSARPAAAGAQRGAGMPGAGGAM